MTTSRLPVGAGDVEIDIAAAATGRPMTERDHQLRSQATSAVVRIGPHRGKSQPGTVEVPPDDSYDLLVAAGHTAEGSRWMTVQNHSSYCGVPVVRTAAVIRRLPRCRQCLRNPHRRIRQMVAEQVAQPADQDVGRRRSVGPAERPQLRLGLGARDDLSLGWNAVCAAERDDLGCRGSHGHPGIPYGEAGIGPRGKSTRCSKSPLAEGLAEPKPTRQRVALQFLRCRPQRIRPSGGRRRPSSEDDVRHRESDDSTARRGNRYRLPFDFLDPPDDIGGRAVGESVAYHPAFALAGMGQRVHWLRFFQSAVQGRDNRTTSRPPQRPAPIRLAKEQQP